MNNYYLIGGSGYRVFYLVTALTPSNGIFKYVPTDQTVFLQEDGTVHNLASALKQVLSHFLTRTVSNTAQTMEQKTEKM
jgi:hypothetical protein